MTDEIVTDICELDLPFGRRATLKNVEHDGGLQMLRLTLRENRRFTIIDLDHSSAKEFGANVLAWAEKQPKKDG